MAAGGKGRKTHAPRQPCQCQLLRLPGELRLRIYRMVVADHFDQSTTLSLFRELSSPNIFKSSPQQPPLALTCRQLRNEALSVFYGERLFGIDPDMGLQNLVGKWSNIMRPSLSHLRRISFLLNTEFSPCTGQFTGLGSFVEVRVQLIGHNLLDYQIQADGTCECKFARCARDVEMGVLGSKFDTALIRFLKAFDIVAPSDDIERLLECSYCGEGNLQASLRQISRRSSCGSTSGSDDSF